MRNADIFSWEHLPLITLTPPSWPTFLRLHVKSIYRSQCKNPKHSKIHSQYVSSLLRPFPKFFPRCCWNLKISHLTLGFQVEPTFHNFSTLVTPMAGQTPVVCFQSQPRVPPMHKNPFSGFPGQLSADGWRAGRSILTGVCLREGTHRWSPAAYLHCTAANKPPSSQTVVFFLYRRIIGKKRNRRSFGNIL